MKNIQLHNVLTKKMKQFVFILLCFSPTIVQAQVNSYGSIKGDKLSGQHPFLDASVFDTIDNKSKGRGLNFPRTDLTKWRFQESKLNGTNFPSAFDGLFVYNSGTGQTIQGEGIVVDVSPGFYYFFNPNQTTNISSGRWERILNDSVDIDTHLDSIVLTNDSIYTPYVGSNALNPYIIPDTIFTAPTDDGRDPDFYKWSINSPPDTITDDVWTSIGLALGNTTHIADSGTYIESTNFTQRFPVVLAGGTNVKIKSPVVINPTAFGLRTFFNWGYNNEIITNDIIQSNATTGPSLVLGSNSKTIYGGGMTYLLGHECELIGEAHNRKGRQMMNIGSGNVIQNSGQTVTLGLNNYMDNSSQNVVLGDSLYIIGNTEASIIIGSKTYVNAANASLIFSLNKREDTIKDTDFRILFLGGKVGIGEVSPTHALTVKGSAGKTVGGDWAAYSDIRSKENIADYTKGLDFVLQLRPVSFNYKPTMQWGTNTNVGLIAQEVEKILPSMVNTHKMVNDIEDFKFLDTNEITYMLINAAKNLKKQNTKNLEKYNLLKIENSRMKAWIKEMNDKLGLK